MSFLNEKLHHLNEKKKKKVMLRNLTLLLLENFTFPSSLA